MLKDLCWKWLSITDATLQLNFQILTDSIEKFTWWCKYMQIYATRIMAPSQLKMSFPRFKFWSRKIQNTNRNEFVVSQIINHSSSVLNQKKMSVSWTFSTPCIIHMSPVCEHYMFVSTRQFSEMFLRHSSGVTSVWSTYPYHNSSLISSGVIMHYFSTNEPQSDHVCDWSW